MKHQFYILIFLLYCTSIFGQSRDTTIAADWTLMDVDEQTHHLYEYLNQGKTVFLYFVVTWNEDCWTYHNHKQLKRLQSLYGPNGTDEVRVIMIEGDPHTGLEELSGNGQRTYGDWLKNTNYPIIDDHSINNIYQIGSWPTLYKICPNKRIKQMELLSAEMLYEKSRGCEAAWGSDNVSILNYHGEIHSFCQSETLTPSILVQNDGWNTLEYCEVEFRQDGRLIETKRWQGQVERLKSWVMNFDPVELNHSSTFSFTALKPNRKTDNNPVLDVLADVNVSAHQSSMNLTLEFHTDDWPEESAWWVRDEYGSIIDSYEQYEPMLPNTDYIFPIELPKPGCYDFEVSDSYGNGLANGSPVPGHYFNGAISLYSQAGVIWDNPDYGFGFNLVFEAGNFVVSNAEKNTEDFGLIVTPNPASDYIDLQFTIPTPGIVDIQLFDLAGKVVKHPVRQNFTNQNIHQTQIDCSTMEKGMYILRLSTPDGAQTKKVIIQ